MFVALTCRPMLYSAVLESQCLCSHQVCVTLTHPRCCAEAAAPRKPELVVRCPPGLEELCLEDIPFAWEATPDAHARSLRKLELSQQGVQDDGSRDNLDATKLATMTALEILRADTPDARQALAAAAPALSRLIRLSMSVGDGEDGRYLTSRAAGGATRQRRLVLPLLMQQLSALPSLRHLEVTDDDLSGVQTLDREAVIPTLEVLHLDLDLQADDQFLAFYEEPGRLDSVHVSGMIPRSILAFRRCPTPS